MFFWHKIKRMEAAGKWDEGGDQNFLMKVISYSFIPILGVVRLRAIRERTWESGLWGGMSRPTERNFKLAFKSVGRGISRRDTHFIIRSGYLFKR